MSYLTAISFTYCLKFLGVMISMLLADVCWTRYFIKIDERHSVAAGIWGAMILMFGSFCTINYVQDKTLLLAAFIGSFLGTYLTVEHKKKEDLKKKRKG